MARGGDRGAPRPRTPLEPAGTHAPTLARPHTCRLAPGRGVGPVAAVGAGRQHSGLSDQLPHPNLCTEPPLRPRAQLQHGWAPARFSPGWGGGVFPGCAPRPTPSLGCRLLRSSICYAECSPNYFLRFVMPYRLDLNPVFKVF